MALIIVLITLLVSVYAFNNSGATQNLSLRPALVVERKQWYRALSHALIHADYAHLLINMYVLWVFGKVCESYFDYYFTFNSRVHFLLFYLLSLIASSAFSIVKHRRNYYYSSVGASGAVMAVVFSTIFFDPWNKLYFFGVLPIPGILFGILYLVYSIYMGRKGTDNIGHDAHFSGAIFGFVYPVLVNPKLIGEFLQKLLGT